MAALTDTEARANLALLLQPSVAPALTDAEVDQLVAVAVIDDPRALAVALYQGWSAKTAKAAGKVDVKAGDVSQSASQLHAHCAAEAARWGAAAGVRTPGQGNGISSVRVRRV